MGAMAGEDYWPNVESDHFVKDLCDALATNFAPEEHISVHLLFYNLGLTDFTLDFRVGKIYEGEYIILFQGAGVCVGHKERLDIVRAICNSPKHIVEIGFGYGYWSDIEEREEVLEEWCELMLALKDRSTLRSLTLNIHGRMDLLYHQGVEAMASMLAHHPSLTHFILVGWHIHSNEIATSLAKALCMNEKIETFTLDNCTVTSIALDVLLQPFIPNDSGIQSKLQGLSLLDLWIIDDSCGKVIGNMLQRNTTLYEFGISMFNPIYPNKFFIGVLEALKENQHLKRVKFRGDNFGGDEILAEVMNLLQKNPSLKVDLQDTPLYESVQSRSLVQALVKRNEQYMAVLNDSFQTITPTSARVFFCGFPHAGKTTLRKQMAKTSLLSKMNSFQKARFKFHREQSTRTVGIEVEMVETSDSITLQLWDLGGQDEFHALHDLVVPNVGDNGLGARCIFILVCSLMNSPHNTTLKEEQNIKHELQYWLKFILSNSTWSPMTCKPHVIIAFTHIDLVPKNLDTEDYVKELMGSLRKFCGNSIDISEQGVFHVNAKSQRSIIQLATYVEGDVLNLLKNGPKVNEACLTMELALAKLNKTKPHKPFLKWEEFILLCKEQEKFIAMFDEASGGLQKICKAVAMALHDSGHVMYFESLEFVVVDPNWFCNKVLGPMLSRVDEVAHDEHKGKAPRSNDGYMEGKVFKSILEDSFVDKKNVRKGMKEVEGVEMDDVIELMKKMNLCYSSDSNTVTKFSQQEDNDMPMSKLFIPAILRDENEDAQQGRRQLSWTSMASSSSSSFIYVGRRLQCEDVDRTFLTLGFFPRLQVVFRRTLGFTDNFFLEKNLISFTYNGMEVFVEYSGHIAPMHLNNLIDGYIDILVKSSRDLETTLQFMQEKMVNQIRELCSSPTFGCQGVILVESILNPECVEKLWLCVDRKNHAIEVEKLVQDVLIANDLEYMHEWTLRGPKDKQIRNFTMAKLLLGERKWEVAVVNKLYMELKDLESYIVAESLPSDVQGFVDELGNPNFEMSKMIEDEFKRHTKIVVDRIDLAENRLAIRMDAVVALQRRVIPEISRNIDKVISFSEQLQQRQVPCIVYITTQDVSTGQWLITSLVPGLSSVQLHFLCEHEVGIHRVESQKGDVLVLEGETLRSIRPYVIWGLRILSILMKAGAQGVVGGGSMVPNLEKMFIKGVAEMIPKVPTNLGEGCVQMEQVNLDLKFGNYEQEVAEQWLVNFLKGKDIGVLFGLYRIKYKSSAKIAWVCKEHKEEGLKNGTMVLLPTS